MAENFLTIFAKSSMLDVWQGSEYVFVSNSLGCSRSNNFWRIKHILKNYKGETYYVDTYDRNYMLICNALLDNLCSLDHCSKVCTRNSNLPHPHNLRVEVIKCKWEYQK